MNKVKVNEGKIFEVLFNVKGDKSKNTVNADGEKVRTKYGYYVYAVNEAHARQIVESYDENAVIESVEELYDAISQHYGE